jgi:RNA polymerase sigma factor (sigma-70 family)
MQLAKTRLHATNSFMEELYQRHRITILTYILQHVPSREDAEDMLLEVFIAALESPIITTLDERQQLGWLRRVALYKSVDYHRRAVRRPAVPIEQASETLYEEEYHSPEQSMLRQEEITLLRAYISSLPELQQEVIRLRFANDLRCSEIATHLNKSEGAVRTLLSRTLNILRGIYEKSRKEPQHD